MGEWECLECGYVHEGEKPPKRCPECGASAEQFEFYEYEDLEDDDFEDDDLEDEEEDEY